MNAVLVPGEATGEVTVMGSPLSFWGGYDPVRGVVTDVSHPQCGETLAGRIVVMAHGRGSSSSASVLAEALRVGTGPAGFVLAEPDQILVTGVLVARLLYGVECPVVVGTIPAGASGTWRIGGTGVVPIR